MDAILTDYLPRTEARLAEIRCALHCAAMQSPSKSPLSLMEARRLSDLLASTVSRLRMAIDAELTANPPAWPMFEAAAEACRPPETGDVELDLQPNGWGQ